MRLTEFDVVLERLVNFLSAGLSSVLTGETLHVDFSGRNEDEVLEVIGEQSLHP